MAQKLNVDQVLQQLSRGSEEDIRDDDCSVRWRLRSYGPTGHILVYLEFGQDETHETWSRYANANLEPM